MARVKAQSRVFPEPQMGILASLPRVTGWMIIVSATVLFALPLLAHEKMHWGMDLSFAAQMTQGMLQGLRDGHLYPRWVDAMSKNFGAPAFLFYPPLSYYASALVTMATHDIAQGIKIVTLASAFLSGLTFFIAARPLSSELGAAAGAALYILLPYHILDLYDRYSFAELAAFIWLPLLFRFVRDLAQRPRWGTAFGLALSFAALILTHTITAYLVLLALVPYGVYRVARTGSWGRLLPIAAAGAAALLCCAVYLVPLMLERENVRFEYFTESFFGNWRRNFAFRDPVEFGFRPSEIRASIEKCVASVGFLSLAIAGLSALRYPRGVGGDVRANGWTYAALSAWVVFLQLPISTPVWATLPGLGTAQFPWRFGILQVLFVSFQAACLLAPARTGGAADRGILRRLRAETRAALAALVVVAIPAGVVSVDLTDTRRFVFDGKLALEPRIQSRVIHEYIPRNSKEIGRLPFAAVRRARLVGPGTFEMVRWTSHARHFRVDANRAGRLVVHTFVYPGWKAFVDGKEVEIEPTTPASLISFNVPPGRHDVEVVFTATLPRSIGAWVSAVSVSVLLGLAIVFWLRSAKRNGRGGAGGEARNANLLADD